MLGEQGEELLSLNLGRILDWDATPFRDDLSSGIWPLHSGETWALHDWHCSILQLSYWSLGAHLEPPFDLSDLSLESGAFNIGHNNMGSDRNRILKWGG